MSGSPEFTDNNRKRFLTLGGIGGFFLSTGSYLLARHVTNPEGLAFPIVSPERVADSTIDALLIPVFATVGIMGGMFGADYLSRRRTSVSTPDRGRFIDKVLRAVGSGAAIGGSIGYALSGDGMIALNCAAYGQMIDIWLTRPGLIPRG